MRKRAGFTLIELLIVMAIIAALMAVLIPTATGAMRKARATRIAVQLRNVEQGVEQYLLATLPATIDSNFRDNLKNNLKDNGFVDASILDDPNLETLTVEASGTTKIKIQIEYDAKDANVASLARDTLAQTYGLGESDGSPEGAYVSDTTVGIVKSIDAFWW
ncbi:type II secretion system protein [Thermotoga sp. SG1]|uniref:type II secretion system protein n=1 Tax=Thermotoga sp. SG1 TaxID=126739 RepID=UPI000C7787C2|nr:type II secretion system protein [Thermotoga sp. SG1]PLV56307.1 type IV pilin [Thermotoga sp. SG1]